MEKNHDDIFTLAGHSESNPLYKKYRKIALEAFLKGLDAVMPDVLIKKKCYLDSGFLHIGQYSISIKNNRPILLLGAGKAVAKMVKGILEILPEDYPIQGIVILPDDQQTQQVPIELEQNSKIKVFYAHHPVPSQEGIEAVEEMIQTIIHTPPDPLILFLISGGASSLFVKPVKSVSLEDLQKTNQLLLKSGARIDEINVIRKHISQIKGGQFAKILQAFDSYALILSDVIGNTFNSIGSGPTAPDNSNFAQAITICHKYSIFEQLPPSVINHLQKGEMGLVPETPKESDPCFKTMHNILIGDSTYGLMAMKEFFEDQGWIAHIFSTNIENNAQKYGISLANQLGTMTAIQYPAVFLGTGELTVELKGNGTGGPNQEMLLSFLNEQASNPSCLARQIKFVILAAATDGKEGNSPAVGAIIDNESLNRVNQMNLNLSAVLENNNSGLIFDKLHDAIILGPTGTNVNDLFLIIRI